jgi:hypothetical protein
MDRLNFKRVEMYQQQSGYSRIRASCFGKAGFEQEEQARGVLLPGRGLGQFRNWSGAKWDVRPGNGELPGFRYTQFFEDQG